MAPKDDSTAAYHIFERLNTGGTPLKPQEIRNSVFHGPIVEALNNLNADKNWRKILGKKTLDKHQRDVEMILRIFAMYEGWERYEKPMKEFLNKAMKGSQQASTQKFKAFSKEFPEVCEKLCLNIGEKPFHVRSPINLAAMDSIMCLALRNPKSDFKRITAGYKRFLTQTNFQEAIFFNTSDAVAIRARMQEAAKLAN